MTELPAVACQPKQSALLWYYPQLKRIASPNLIPSPQGQLELLSVQGLICYLNWNKCVVSFFLQSSLTPLADLWLCLFLPNFAFLFQHRCWFQHICAKLSCWIMSTSWVFFLRKAQSKCGYLTGPRKADTKMGFGICTSSSSWW